MGTEGGTSLEGVVGYAFEAEGSVSGCLHGPPAFTVSTIVRDQCPGGYIRLSSWYKPWLTAPCGFEVCFLVLRKPDEYATEAEGRIIEIQPCIH